MLLCTGEDNGAKHESKRVPGGDPDYGNDAQSTQGVWSQRQLQSLVWALGHSNQDVLDYTAWTMLVRPWSLVDSIALVHGCSCRGIDLNATRFEKTLAAPGSCVATPRCRQRVLLPIIIGKMT